jgi:hypothetical protein
MAHDTADACIKALKKTGRDNEYLESLVEYTVKREK